MAFPVPTLSTNELLVDTQKLKILAALFVLNMTLECKNNKPIFDNRVHFCRKTPKSRKYALKTWNVYKPSNIGILYWVTTTRGHGSRVMPRPRSSAWPWWLSSSATSQWWLGSLVFKVPYTNIFWEFIFWYLQNLSIFLFVEQWKIVDFIKLLFCSLFTMYFKQTCYVCDILSVTDPEHTLFDKKQTFKSNKLVLCINFIMTLGWILYLSTRVLLRNLLFREKMRRTDNPSDLFI